MAKASVAEEVTIRKK